MFLAYCLMVLYNCEKFHQNIWNGFQLTEWTQVHGRNGYVQYSKGNNSKSRQTRVTVHVFWMSSSSALHQFVCVCFSWALRRFLNNLSVISRWCLDVAGSSMLTFRVLPHWNIMPQTLDMIFHPVTLYWHWADQFWFLLSWCRALSERAARTIFKVSGMTQAGIESATSRSQSRRSTEPLCRYFMIKLLTIC